MADSSSQSDRLEVSDSLRAGRYVHQRTESAHHPPPSFKKAGGFFLFFGVLVPIAAIIHELNFHMCATYVVDPLPSMQHVALVSLVPFTNLMYWLACRRDMSSHYGLIALTNGMALGVALIYSVMMLPIVPAAAVACLLGIGLLPLSPLLAIPCIWIGARGTCKLAADRKGFVETSHIKHVGHLLILFLLIAMELPSTLTRMHLNEAAIAADPRDALNWLRTWGSEEVMLRACYERCGRATDVIGSLSDVTHPLEVSQARDLFYKVTGKPYNSVSIPMSMRATMMHSKNNQALNFMTAEHDVSYEFDYDPDIAGEMVSGVARGLSLDAWSLHGHITSDIAVAKMTLSLTFKNTSEIGREARAQLLLPHNGVVNGARLIANGVTKEAKIIARSQARALYRASVVEKRQDPLLVSLAGADQVLLQCYPVPERGVPMTVELDIVAPLQEQTPGHFVLIPPTFDERNFVLEQPLSVQVDSEAPLTVSTPKKNETGASLAADLSPSDLAHFNDAISLETNGTYARDVMENNSRLNDHVHQVGRLHIVIDTSIGMAPYMGQIAETIKQLPEGTFISIDAVDDNGTTSLVENCRIEKHSQNLIDGLRKVSSIHCVGGQNDFQAVSEPLKRGESVMWFHTSQPMSQLQASTFSSQLQSLSSSPLSKADLYDVLLTSGPDPALSAVFPYDHVIRIPHTGDLKTAATWLSRLWENNGRKPRIRELLISSSNLSLIEPLQYRGMLATTSDYSGYAIAKHIVSPFSSAVVADDPAPPPPKYAHWHPHLRRRFATNKDKSQSFSKGYGEQASPPARVMGRLISTNSRPMVPVSKPMMKEGAIFAPVLQSQPASPAFGGSSDFKLQTKEQTVAQLNRMSAMAPQQTTDIEFIENNPPTAAGAPGASQDAVPTDLAKSAVGPPLKGATNGTIGPRYALPHEKQDEGSYQLDYAQSQTQPADSAPLRGIRDFSEAMQVRQQCQVTRAAPQSTSLSLIIIEFLKILALISAVLAVIYVLVKRSWQGSLK